MNPMHRLKSGSKCTELCSYEVRGALLEVCRDAVPAGPSRSKCRPLVFDNLLRRRITVAAAASLPRASGTEKDRQLLKSARLASRCNLFPPSRRECGTDRHRPLAHIEQSTLTSRLFPQASGVADATSTGQVLLVLRSRRAPSWNEIFPQHVCLSPRVGKIAGAAH